MDRLETRELSYFVAVAEALHFGRAAQRLGIAQPPLSRAIQQLERRLGVTLLERSSQKVTLTAAGEVLLHEGRRALDAVAAASRRAKRAGQPDRLLVLVMKAGGDGGLLPDVLAAYQTEALLVERQVVVLPERHRLAGRASVLLADLQGEMMPRWPGVPDDDATGPVVQDVGQLLQLIALGRMVAVLPESVLGYVHRHLVCVPVVDAPATTLVVAWPEGSRSLAAAAFVRAATAVAAHRQPQPATRP